MALLSLLGVTLNLGGKTLLDPADLHVEQGERVCLVGRNGVGKSSLMALLSGDLTPDGGTIVRTPGVTFGHMPQAVPDHWSGPVIGVVASGLGKEGEALAADHLIATLSGGNKRRVALARALVASENLLLDEPTNHLDIKTIAWLEDFLVRRVKTFVFISHDRAFVRRLATRSVEVDRSQLYSYACTFDQFLERREERLDAEEKQAAAFDKKLAQEEAWIRQGIKARRTRNMGRVRALQAMRSERMARVSRQGVVSMLAQEAERSGKLVIETGGIRLPRRLPRIQPLFDHHPARGPHRAHRQQRRGQDHPAPPPSRRTRTHGRLHPARDAARSQLFRSAPLLARS